MINRFKLFAVAALGLALATGAVADASAKTIGTHPARTVHAKAGTHKIHRLAVAHAARVHRIHVAHRPTARHAAKQHLAETGAPRSPKAGRTTKRQHQAMAHHAGGKTIVTR